MLQTQGHLRIAGVDEVGRGALAGPVVVAAVILPAGTHLQGVYDSKTLSARQRRSMAGTIKLSGAAIGVGWVHANTIDEIGLTAALRQAALIALAQLDEYQMVILDGKHNYLADEVPSQAHIDADATELCVAAASIIAKVARDEWMGRLHASHPQYGFATNVGYGSAAHLVALNAHGATRLHRQSFGPVRRLFDVD